MSKSLGNYVGVTESPDEIFGKLMSIPDSVIIDYYRLLTRLSKSEIDDIENEIKNKDKNPVFAKRQLAGIIVKNLYSAAEAKNAEESFDFIFKEKKTPDDIEEFVIYKKDIKDGSILIVNILVNSGLAESKSQARRLLSQGAVKIDDVRIDDVESRLKIKDINDKVIKKGKRFFRRIIIR